MGRFLSLTGKHIQSKAVFAFPLLAIDCYLQRTCNSAYRSVWHSLSDSHRHHQFELFRHRHWQRGAAWEWKWPAIVAFLTSILTLARGPFLWIDQHVKAFTTSCIATWYSFLCKYSSTLPSTTIYYAYSTFNVDLPEYLWYTIVQYQTLCKVLQMKLLL